MSALMDAEAEAKIKLDERLDQLEEKVERQTELLHRMYSAIGSISSAM
jgi:tetrahydromethanopterin S-methyltransferase subunit G